MRWARRIGGGNPVDVGGIGVVTGVDRIVFPTRISGRVIDEAVVAEDDVVPVVPGGLTGIRRDLIGAEATDPSADPTPDQLIELPIS